MTLYISGPFRGESLQDILQAQFRNAIKFEIRFKWGRWRSAIKFEIWGIFTKGITSERNFAKPIKITK